MWILRSPETSTASDCGTEGHKIDLSAGINTQFVFIWCSYLRWQPSLGHKIQVSCFFFFCYCISQFFDICFFGREGRCSVMALCGNISCTLSLGGLLSQPIHKLRPLTDCGLLVDAVITFDYGQWCQLHIAVRGACWTIRTKSRLYDWIG